MSHIASFLYFNALFEVSFFRAEHLTASEKYKFSRQECVIREVCFAKTTKTSKCLARRDAGTCGNLFTASDETLEPAEIPSPRTTEHWNLRKFFHSERQGAGASGNLSTASDETLERTEICSPRLTRHWNRRKFVPSMQWNTGTGGKQARVLRSKTR